MVARDRGVLQIVRHPVEGGRDLADLVPLASAMRYARSPCPSVPIPAMSRRMSSVSERASSRRPRRPAWRHGSRSQEDTPEGARRCEGLRRVERRYDAPAQVRNRQGCIRGEDWRPVPQIGGRAGLTVQSRPGIRGRDLLEQDGAPVRPHELEHIGGYASRRDRLQV